MLVVFPCRLNRSTTVVLVFFLLRLVFTLLIWHDEKPPKQWEADRKCYYQQVSYWLVLLQEWTLLLPLHMLQYFVFKADDLSIVRLYRSNLDTEFLEYRDMSGEERESDENAQHNALQLQLRIPGTNSPHNPHSRRTMGHSFLNPGVRGMDDSDSGSQDSTPRHILNNRGNDEFPIPQESLSLSEIRMNLDRMEAEGRGSSL